MLFTSLVFYTHPVKQSHEHTPESGPFPPLTFLIWGLCPASSCPPRAPFEAPGLAALVDGAEPGEDEPHEESSDRAVQVLSLNDPAGPIAEMIAPDPPKIADMIEKLQSILPK